MQLCINAASQDDQRVPIKLLCLVLVFAVPAEAPARTATAAEREACEAKIQPKIDAIDSRLRGGYSASEGERLKQQRRKLVEKRDACRRIR